MSSRLIIIAALWALCGAHSAGTPLSDTQKAVVGGTVTDPSFATIPNAEVYFIRGKENIAVRTSPTGRYSAELAPGIYSMRVEYLGFCNGLRGEFSAREGSEFKFDFVLRVGTIEDGYTVAPDGATTIFSHFGGCYQSEELPAPVPNGPKPLVLYEKREVNGDVVRYSGLRDNSATYMYDQLTVKATTLEYSAKNHSIEGSGMVTWQDVQTSKRGSQIHVSFRDDKPQIDLKDY